MPRRVAEAIRQVRQVALVVDACPRSGHRAGCQGDAADLSHQTLSGGRSALHTAGELCADASRCGRWSGRSSTQGWLKVCPRFPDEVAGQLEPAAALEDDVEHDSEGSHREDRERVTQFPAEFGHVLEVHAVDGAYQGRREENGGPGRDAFDVVVLVEVVWVSRLISSFWR